MKKFKRIMALVIALAMVLSMGLTAFAEPVSNDHTITITNTDQNVVHTFVGYKVFSGNLDNKEMVLSDIAWANADQGASLLAAIKASTDNALKATSDDLEEGKDALGKELSVGQNIFTNCTSAADVAKILATFQSTGQKYDEITGVATSDNGTTDSAGRIDAFATILGDNLTMLQSVGTFTNNETNYTLDVTGDGYYFVKDTTTALNNDNEGTSDTLSKYILAVVKDVTIVAKDTGLNPDKEIEQKTKDGNSTATGETVKADSAAIGDTVDFDVEITVPNTKKYEDHFVFVMNDTLPAGLTFTGVQSIKIYDGTTEKASLTAGTNYTVTAKTAPATEYSAYEVPTDPVLATGGQAIKIVFNNFKNYVEADYDTADGVQDLIGKKIVIKYTAVLNDDAQYQAQDGENEKNENKVTFDYSNDPNHDYTGDEAGPQEPKGTTPESKTRTYTTSLKIKKVDEKGQPLGGATFELKGNTLNRTVLTGYKFVEESYVPVNGEVIDTTANYWKLKDGSYTTTDPATLQNPTQYEDKVDGAYKKYYRVNYTFDEVKTKETDIVVVTSSDDGANKGIAEFVGLNEGTGYTLEEIAAPDGYNKIDGKSKFNITWIDPEGDKPAEMSDEDWNALKARGGFTLTESDADADHKFGIAWNATTEQFEVTIENHSGSVLPSTGGIGTTIFYVVGAILVIGAGVILITRRRMDA